MELTFRNRLRPTRARPVATSPLECHCLLMGVRGKRKIALLFAAYIASFIMCEYAFSKRARAQESTDTIRRRASSEQATSESTNRPTEPTDEPESGQKEKPADQSGRRPDPVFQAQNAPPSQPTLAEKKAPLLDRRESEAAAKQTESPQPPPQPVEERRPPAPAVHYIWVPGFWYWYDYQYIWISGRWIAPRPGYVFVRPRWTRRAGVWVFLPGGWAIAGSSSIVHPLEIGIFVRPWLRHHRYHRRHHRHFGRHRPRGRVFHPSRGPRPRARITTRRATQPRSRARHR